MTGAPLEDLLQGDVDYHALQPVLRVLLITDGTVTETLAAYFNEPIKVTCINQQTLPLPSPCPPLMAEIGIPVIEREVALVGNESAKVYVHARSIIRVDGLDGEFRRMLDSGAAGIGELLAARNFETSRQILTIGRRSSLPGDFRVQNPAAGEYCYRSYLIYTRGRPVIQVTEYYPLAVYNG